MPETQYVIHRGDSYLRVAQHGGRLLAVMVRDSREASRFNSATAAIITAMQSDIGLCREWAVEAVKGRAS